MKIPNPEPLNNASNIGSLPYCFVADEAFPLLTNLMRPFPGRNSNQAQEAYNYRLSRARRVVENAFGILANRWRVFHTKIGTSPGIAIKIVKACCVIHNMIGIEPGLLHNTDRGQQQSASHENSSNCSNNSISVREQFVQYFTQHPLAWQNKYVFQGAE